MSKKKLNIDIETVTNSQRDAQILLIGYSVNGEEPKVVSSFNKLPKFLKKAIKQNNDKHSPR